MKIICLDSGHVLRHMPFHIKPASALLLPHNPFFYPDFSKKIEARLGVAIRVSKPGRSVAAKFAHLHYDSFAVALDLVAADLLEACRTNGVPCDMASSFDGSFPVGKFQEISLLDGSFDDVAFSLSINGDRVAGSRVGNMAPGFDAFVENVSQFVTLREGDYVFASLPDSHSLNVGDRIEIGLGDTVSFWFNIR